MIVRVGVAVAVNIFVVSYNSQTPFNTDTDGAIENVRISGVRAVARFFVKVGGGGGYRECRRHEPCRGSGGILPQKLFKFGGSEMLFSALVMRYVSEKSTSNMNRKEEMTTLASHRLNVR